MSGYQGTITPSGYQPPPGTRVRWTRHGGDEKVFTLRSRFEWDGLNSSAESFYDRYAAGQSKIVEGMYIIGVNDKLEGGEAFAILQHLFERAGVTRPPKRPEYWDFAISNHDGSGGPLTVADWPRLTGQQKPGAPEGGTVGQEHDPIPVLDPRYPHGTKLEIAGKWYFNDLGKGSQGKGPFPGSVKPVDPPPPGVDPSVKPPAVGLAPLSPASRRVEELRSMVVNLNFWVTSNIHQEKRLGVMLGGVVFPMLKPFAVEALRFYRRLRQKLGDPRPLPKEDS